MPLAPTINTFRACFWVMTRLRVNSRCHKRQPLKAIKLSSPAQEIASGDTMARRETHAKIAKMLVLSAIAFSNDHPRSVNGRGSRVSYRPKLRHDNSVNVQYNISNARNSSLVPR